VRKGELHALAKRGCEVEVALAALRVPIVAAHDVILFVLGSEGKE
jgi:hypothetical protein